MPRFVNTVETPAIQNQPYIRPLTSEIIDPKSLGRGVIRDYLQSENYIQGSQGWKLSRDGVIEALSIVIAGDSTIAGWSVNSTSFYKTNAVLSSNGYVAFGSTPPSAYGNNVGAWLGIDAGSAKMSLYNDANNYLQWDGTKALIKATNFTLDSSGNITASNATVGGTINATAGTFTGTVTVSGVLQSNSTGARWVINNTPTFSFYDSSFERMRLSSDRLQFWDSSGTSAGYLIGETVNSIPSVRIPGNFATSVAYVGLGMTVGGSFTLEVDIPGSSSSIGITGQLSVDSDYIYVCTATDTWKRVALSTF